MLAHLRVSQWCLCSKELRITVPRSALCSAVLSQSVALLLCFHELVDRKDREIQLVLVETWMKYL